MNLDHYQRGLDLVDPTSLNFPIALIGAGGIGSWTALALGKMGCQNILVVDMDQVEPQNVGCQFYKIDDLGIDKVIALAENLQPFMEGRLTVANKELKKTGNEGLTEFPIVISAVDDIDVRRWIFDSLKGSKVTFIDGRMAGDAIQVFTVPMGEPNAVKMYEESLFTKEEADEVACTSRAVVYNCFVMAGIIASVVAKFSKNQANAQELTCDLKSYFMDNWRQENEQL